MKGRFRRAFQEGLERSRTKVSDRAGKSKAERLGEAIGYALVFVVIGATIGGLLLWVA